MSKKIQISLKDWQLYYTSSGGTNIATVILYQTHPDGDKRLITGGWENKYVVLNLRTKKVEKEKANGSTIYSLKIVKLKGKYYLLSGDYAPKFKIMELPSLDVVKEISFSSYVWRLCLVGMKREFCLICSSSNAGFDIHSLHIENFMEDREKNNLVYNYDGTFTCIWNLEKRKEMVVLGGSSEFSLCMVNWKTKNEMWKRNVESDGWIKTISSFVDEEGNEKILTGGSCVVTKWDIEGNREKSFSVAENVGYLLKFNDDLMFFGGAEGSIFAMDLKKSVCEMILQKKDNFVHWMCFIEDGTRGGKVSFAAANRFLNVFEATDGISKYIKNVFDEDMLERLEFLNEKDGWKDFKITLRHGLEIQNYKYIFNY